MEKGIIRLHDKLSSDGDMLSASSSVIFNGIKAALINDLVSFPIAGHGVDRIVGTSPQWQSFCQDLHTEETNEPSSSASSGGFITIVPGADAQHQLALNDLLRRAQLSSEQAGNEALATSWAKNTVARIVGFLASWEVMIGMFLIEQLINYYYGNDLQQWCREGVFGLEPEGNLKSTWMIGPQKPRDKEYDNQQEAFQKALGAVL